MAISPLRVGNGRLAGVVVSFGLLTSCGASGSEPTPPPTPTAEQDTWYSFVVQCGDCPGLTNAQIDRTATPYRAKLRVGQATSLRATIRATCEALEAEPRVVRWVASDPTVIRVEPSSTESAIVTALAPGTSAITVERQLPSGAVVQMQVKDPGSASSCGPLPDVVFEISS